MGSTMRVRRITPAMKCAKPLPCDRVNGRASLHSKHAVTTSATTGHSVSEHSCAVVFIVFTVLVNTSCKKKSAKTPDGRRAWLTQN